MKSQKIFIVIGILIIVAAAVFLAKPKTKGELPAEYLSLPAPRDTFPVLQAGEAYSDKRPALSPDLLAFINKNLVSGGPPKDGIPAIDNPKYVSAQEAEQLGIVKPGETVFGIARNGEVKAYPQSIMYWHEIVNEEFGGEKVSITYCPLTGSIIGYKDVNLGVSGELYNSNLVLYDRATDSVIPQILGAGIDGPLEGQYLKRVHVIVTSWEQWKAKYPETLVLTRDTGYTRDYDRTPYPGYEDILRVWFPLAAESDTFPTKKWVFGVEFNGEFIAVPKDEFKAVGSDTVQLGGKEVRLEYDNGLDVLHAYIGEEELTSIQMHWFAWYAYHPNTKVWS